MPARLRFLAPLAVAGLAIACSGLDELRSGNLDVEPAVIDRAGRSPDPSLEAPLLAILDRRLEGGYTAIDDARVVAAIQALERRGAASAVPALEGLVFDPVGRVEFHALAALETLGGESSLPTVAEAATKLSRDEVREQAYRTFAVLSGTPLNHLDEVALARILADHGHSVRSR